MATNKTEPPGASVKDYIASRAKEQQRADVRELMALLKSITKHPPKMWGAQHGRVRLPALHLRERAHR